MTEPYLRNGLAIINPYGGIWTDRIFETPEAALKYLRDYWGEGSDISRFKLASAVVEVRLLYKPTSEPVFVPFPTEKVA